MGKHFGGQCKSSKCSLEQNHAWWHSLHSSEADFPHRKHSSFMFSKHQLSTLSFSDCRHFKRKPLLHFKARAKKIPLSKNHFLFSIPPCLPFAIIRGHPPCTICVLQESSAMIDLSGCSTYCTSQRSMPISTISLFNIIADLHNICPLSILVDENGAWVGFHTFFWVIFVL